MDALIGGDEDDDAVESLLDIDASRQDDTAGELEFDSIIEQVGVQRLFQQLHSISCCGPAHTNTRMNSIYDHGI